MERMTAQNHPYKTINTPLVLWNQLNTIKENHKLKSLTAVIEKTMEQNKKLKNKIYDLERELEAYKNR